jgi:hypothetical protein
MNNHLCKLRGLSLEQLFRDVVVFLSRWFDESDSGGADELARKCRCLVTLEKSGERASRSLTSKISAIVDILGR